MITTHEFASIARNYIELMLKFTMIVSTKTHDQEWRKGLTFKIKSESVFGIRHLTVGVIKQVNAESPLRATRTQEVISAHSVSHTQCGISITVVIVKHGRQDSVLSAIHEAIPGTVGGGA